MDSTLGGLCSTQPASLYKQCGTMGDNPWMLLIPILVLVLVTAPVFAWMHRFNERQLREGADRDPMHR